MNYDALQNDIEQNIVEINDFIANSMDISVPHLKEACYHLFGAGGKRIRPYIMRKAYEIFRPRNSEIVPIAAAIEILHTFTLVHDDIMDQDEFRRGISTVHVKWNNNVAILVGDVLQALVFSLIGESSLNPAIKGHLVTDVSKSIIKICEGQALDLHFEQKSSVLVSEYLKMIKLKTGELLGLSARLGGVVAETDPQMVEVLSQFGVNYGVAFQIRDDILGVIADEAKLGKPVGSDLRQGKKSFVTLYALNNLPKESTDELASIMASEENSYENIARGIVLVKESGAIEEAETLTEKYSKLALKNLSQLSPSQGRDHLEKLVEYSLKRDY
ncbi:MAG: polyprenyl synthetase family protein [Promethearchaeota archaeon]